MAYQACNRRAVILPTSLRAFGIKVLERITEISRDRTIKSLEHRVRVLEEENEALRREIERYRNQEFEIKVFLQKFNIQFKRMKLVIGELLREMEKMKKENEEIRRSLELMSARALEQNCG